MPTPVVATSLSASDLSPFTSEFIAPCHPNDNIMGENIANKIHLLMSVSLNIFTLLDVS